MIYYIFLFELLKMISKSKGVPANESLTKANLLLYSVLNLDCHKPTIKSTN